MTKAKKLNLMLRRFHDINYFGVYVGRLGYVTYVNGWLSFSPYNVTINVYDVAGIKNKLLALLADRGIEYCDNYIYLLTYCYIYSMLRRFPELRRIASRNYKSFIHHLSQLIFAHVSNDETKIKDAIESLRKFDKRSQIMRDMYRERKEVFATFRSFDNMLQPFVSANDVYCIVPKETRSGRYMKFNECVLFDNKCMIILVKYSDRNEEAFKGLPIRAYIINVKKKKLWVFSFVSQYEDRIAMFLYYIEKRQWRKLYRWLDKYAPYKNELPQDYFIELQKIATYKDLPKVFKDTLFLILLRFSRV